MATLKRRFHQKNAEGTYDVLHLETSADMVLTADGRTVETVLAGKANINHTHTMADISDAGGAIDAATLNGKTAQDIIDMAVMMNGMASNKYGYMVKFVDANDEPLVNFPVYRVNNGTVDSGLCGYTNKSGTISLILENASSVDLWCSDESNRKYAYGHMSTAMGQIASETLKADKKFELRFVNPNGVGIDYTTVYKNFGNNVRAFSTGGNGYVSLLEFLKVAGNKVSSTLTLSLYDMSWAKYAKDTVALNLANGLVKTIKADGTLGIAMGITTVGELVRFNNEDWRVAHIESDTAYLTRYKPASGTTWGSTALNPTYATSTLKDVAKAYEDNLPMQWQSGLKFVTTHGVTSRVFVATKAQMEGGWSYFNSDERRKCEPYTSGVVGDYWSSTPRTTNSVWGVNSAGKVTTCITQENVFGFRPSVAVPLQ